MVNTSAQEIELLQQMISGDARAFSEIYELHHDKIYAFAYRLTKSRETAQDMAQEIFIKLWEKRDLIKVELNFGAYLRKMTQNHVFNFLKKASLDRNIQETIKKKMLDLQNSKADELFEKELEKAYNEAIEKLPPQKKLVYSLSRQEDLSYEEIAKKLNISRNTVRNHMVESIRLIREYVNSHTDLACLVLAMCMSGVLKG